jgi:uncharacterized surface protein with fasciclin (FAS1) repeats
MKKMINFSLIAIIAFFGFACNASTNEVQPSTEESQAVGGQSAVQDDESQKDIVKVAASSKDHSTLVAAVKQAELVDVCSNQYSF